MSSRAKKALLFFLRFVLPGVASVTGILAWLFAANINNEQEASFVLEPDAQYPPVTLQIQVPEIPTIDESPTGNAPIGNASCSEDSRASNGGIRCISSDLILDPCYLPPEPDPGSVFCFDPVSFSYDVYDLIEISEIISDGEGPEATFILVDLTDERNFSDYPEEAIEVRGRFVDVCTLDDKSAIGELISYSCVTGSSVEGPILGQSPDHFVQYRELGSDSLTSRYLSYIVYG